MSFNNDRKLENDQKRQRTYDRAYRKSSLFLAGIAAPIMGRKLMDLLKENKKK